MLTDLDLASSIQSQASQCVKCGLCLPYCPTYTLTQNENESPRGRIALMQNIATEALSISLKAHSHIDNCLSCKECERVCPAQVSYEQLLLDYRAWEKPKLSALHSKISFSAHFFEYIAAHPKILRSLAVLLWGIQTLGIQTLSKKVGLIKRLGLTRLNALLPKALVFPKAILPFYPAIGPQQGTVALFTGCLSTLFDAKTHQDAITVLQHLGYAIYIPQSQTCCGAIARHSGNVKQATSLLEQNLKAFSAQNLISNNITHIITTASGCASMLLHSKIANIIDISDFICQITWPETILSTLSLKQAQFSHEKIAVHTPCTLRNSLKKPLVSQNMLEKLGLSCQPLPSLKQGPEQCCGSAGTYMLSHLTTSEQLLDKALINLEKMAPTRLVTSNIGCALHFQKRFTQQNKPIRVCHPISLFAEMLAKD